jgi:hypothetical protein
MFQVRDYSLFAPSPNAERTFRALRRMDYMVNTAIGVLLVLCAWNMVTLVQLRLISNQDLAGVSDIISEPSTKLIWLVALATLGLIVAREWYFGERSIGVVYPLVALLAILLVPAMMSEIQPALRDQTLRIVMSECPPKAIVNGQLETISRCSPHAINEGDVLLATSNPAEGAFETLDPVAGGQNTIAFTMSGRGTYTVYFMFRQDDMAACEGAMLFPRSGVAEAGALQCVESDGVAWLVLPHTTSANSPSGIHLVNVTLP